MAFPSVTEVSPTPASRPTYGTAGRSSATSHRKPGFTDRISRSSVHAPLLVLGVLGTAALGGCGVYQVLDHAAAKPQPLSPRFKNA